MAKKHTTWRQKLANDQGLPKVQEITPNLSQRWGTGTFVIAKPREVDEIMRRVREGKLVTINEIRASLAKKHGATIACPLTTGIFAWVAAHPAEEAKFEGEEDTTPYWRTLKSGGLLNSEYPCGLEGQAALLEAEGHTIEKDKAGKPKRVKDFEKKLASYRSRKLNFSQYVARMPELLAKLKMQPLLKRDDLASVPKAGIYVFYENGEASYVGRSNRIKGRVQEHSRPSSNHYSATFAFILACKECDRHQLLQRSERERQPEFKEAFDKAKNRVASMTIRVVEVQDQIEQSLFEVYAALELQTTKYNDFGTH